MYLPYCAAYRQGRQRFRMKQRNQTAICIGRTISLKWVRRFVSRVLSTPVVDFPTPGGRWPFVWDVCRHTPHATYPDDNAETHLPVDEATDRRPYSVLLPVGFTVPAPSPARRCALTAPFHPYPANSCACPRGGLLSVALSLELPPPDVIRHRASMEPGLSSNCWVSPLQSAAIQPPDPISI